MTVYYRPLLSDDPVRPADAVQIAGGWTWATHAERIVRGVGRSVVPISKVPADLAETLTRPRPSIAGLVLHTPKIMGILNTTPDSFSDGGRHAGPKAAVAHGRKMLKDGADILDIGGESTRPGADTIPEDVEIARTEPVIRALAQDATVSIDTRKSRVAKSALSAGARIVNDVSALTFDPGMAAAVSLAQVPVILMHAQGTPKTMQTAPAYDDVLLDVFDSLAAAVSRARAAGVLHDRIVVDPGIGFGKTIAHNLALLSGLSLFHGLGCPILVGASRKRFVGTLTGVPDAEGRDAGSVGAALAAVAQGVQIVRVHDTLATKQAMTLWQASRGQ